MTEMLEAETAPQGAPETAAPEVVSTPASEPVASEPAPVAAAPQPAPSDPMAPVKALLDERDRRQAAERRAAELEARERQREAQRRQQPRPHVLEKPEEYDAYLDNRFNSLEQIVEDRVSFERERMSRVSMKRHLGADKFKELEAFIEAAPDNAHAMAAQDDDPYGWFHEHFERAQKQKKLMGVEERLGGKDLDAYLEEQKQKWLADNAVASPAEAVAEPEPGQPRGPDGKFASPSTPQRRSAPSLAAVAGVITSAGGEPASGYDALFKRG